MSSSARLSQSSTPGRPLKEAWIVEALRTPFGRYGMMLDDVENPGDSVFMANGVRVYVDEKAVPLIQGSTVDYVDAMMGAGFTVENPNSVGGCGCGSSFRTADSAGQASACSH